MDINKPNFRREINVNGGAKRSDRVLMSPIIVSFSLFFFVGQTSVFAILLLSIGVKVCSPRIKAVTSFFIKNTITYAVFNSQFSSKGIMTDNE